jgi:hypothetical protein
MSKSNGNAKAAATASKLPENAPNFETLDIDELIRVVKAKRIYPGTEQNLYSYSKLGWENYQDKQPEFESYNSEFTEELATDNLAAIAAAKAMPSFEELRAGHVVARNDLMKLTQPVINNWVQLKGYILLTYNKTDQPAMLSAAGIGYYESAAKFSWDMVETLAQRGITFMDNHGAALIAKGMPAAFPTTFETAYNAFIAQRAVFMTKEKVTREGIRNKAAANEAVYAELVRMTEAGKIIYRLNDFEKKDFTVSQLLKLVRGNSPSGLKGRITTGMLPIIPLANVLVYNQNDPARFTRTDADGKYELHIASGLQSVKVELEGYASRTLERKITVGTVHRQSFTLEPVMVAELGVEV